MPKKLILIAAGLAVLSGAATAALHIEQAKLKPSAVLQMYNPQQPGSFCLQNCTLIPQPPNVMVIKNG
jgi:hypothetical protein